MSEHKPRGKSSMASNAIEIRGLTKTYGGGRNSPAKQALKGIDLDVPQGSVFGLLGPNGAGKSTLINILAGLVVKTAGQVTIWGFDQDRNPRQSRASIGVMPQELNLDPFFTPRGALEVQRVGAKHIFGGSGKVIADVFGEVIKLLFGACEGNISVLGEFDCVFAEFDRACREECIEHGAGVHILTDLAGEAFKAGRIACAGQGQRLAAPAVIRVRLPERDQSCERVGFGRLMLERAQAGDVASLQACHDREAAIGDFAIGLRG